jgi:hypothetical protein
MIRDIYLDNVLRERWNDDPTATTDTVPIPARSVRFYTAAGATQSTRAYTTAENAAADVRTAQALAASNSNTIRQLLNDTMPVLDTITNTTNANMVGNTAAAAIKDEARALRRIIRLLTDNLSGTS